MSENVESTENKLTLSIADIELMTRIIDHAASEGAFKGIGIMAQVVGCRQRVGAFLAAALPKKEENDAESDPVADADGETEYETDHRQVEG